MTYDFAPLFRTAIGFDRLTRLVDGAAQAAGSQSYPPYNIEKSADDAYVLTMAVAGFGHDDIDLTVKDNTLVVTGRVAPRDASGEMLYRGIAARAFERHFALAEHIQVEQADLDNGLLRVFVRRVVPEALKPRRVAINTRSLSAPANDGQPTLDASAA